jgi:hypothetical protein
MKAHYEKALVHPHKTIETAYNALKERNAKPEKNKDGLNSAAQWLLGEFHNHVENIWIGESDENSRLQENVDPKPQWFDNSDKLRKSRLQTHLQKMADKFAIPGVALQVSREADVKVKTEYVARE